MLAERVEFVAARDAEIFASVPASSAVFILRGGHAESDSYISQPYISKTANLRRRLQRLLGLPGPLNRRLNLRERVLCFEYSRTGSDFESGLLLYQALRHSFPKAYASRLRLRFAPLIKLHLENEHPRASVSTRIGRLGGRSLYYGPFHSRLAAEQFANDSLDFFKLRRCVEDLTPDPLFPGCIYSEMKMCLAPCFKGCTSEEYSAEAGRVQAYFDSRGESLLRILAGERDEASAKMDFENAAALHARMEKVRAVLNHLPETVHRLDRLNALMVQPGIETNCVNLFKIRGGLISTPIPFAIQTGDRGKSQSMESRLFETINAAGEKPPGSALELMEHLAIFKRWFYRSSRIGEVFFAEEKDVLPMRRIVRGISRVYRGEKPEIAS